MNWLSMTSIKFSGRKISYKIIGSSHSKNIKAKIKGIPDFEFSVEEIKNDLQRRNPKMFFNTQRKEFDEFECSRDFKNKTINVVFNNNDVNKTHYQKNSGFLRPNHSDYSQYLKNKKIETGGGCFSGRMTLPIVFVGSITKQILEKENIKIYTRIKQIGNVKDKKLTKQNDVIGLDKNFPVLTETFKNKAFQLLEKTQKEKNSLGGVLEVVVFGAPKGLGNAYFERLESKLASSLFSIPLIKGVEFGDGFDLAKHKGSEVQDNFFLCEDNVLTKKNHCGGINGGVSNGMPIVIRAAIKPVPTIGKELRSLNIENRKEETVVFEGNHDVCVVNRIIPVVESVLATAILDEMLYEKEKN